MIALYRELNQRYPKAMTALKMLTASAATAQLGPWTGALVTRCLGS